MSEDIDAYMTDSDNSSCYLESLARTRRLLFDTDLVGKLDEVIEAEIELALLGANKAKSEILKQNKESTIRPIK